MPMPLKQVHVVERLRSYSSNNYVYIGSVMKGVALAGATYVAFEILKAKGAYLPRIGPWVASIAALVLSYVKWGRGTLLTNARSNLFDTVLPLAMGMTEYALFGILAPASDPLWSYWFLVFAAHSFLAVLLVLNRWSNAYDEDFEGKVMVDLKGEYIEWLKLDILGASGACVGSVLLWLLQFKVLKSRVSECHLQEIHSALAALAGAVLLKPMLDAERERRIIDDRCGVGGI